MALDTCPNCEQPAAMELVNWTAALKTGDVTGCLGWGCPLCKEISIDPEQIRYNESLFKVVRKDLK